MKSVLYSSRSFGGAEVYVRMLLTEFHIPFTSLQDKSLFHFIELLFEKDRYILHDVRAGVFGLLRWRSKDIVVIHGPGYSKIYMNLFLTLAWVRGLKVIFVSQDILERSWVKRRTWAVLQNISYFKVPQRCKGNNFIYFGRASRSKGVNNLVDYWESSQRAEDLHIIGDGDVLTVLKQKNLKNVHFHGAQNHDYITNIIQQNVGFYISLSPREGLSLSLLESMSAGLVPIVVDMPSQSFVNTAVGCELVQPSLANIKQVIESCQIKQNDLSRRAQEWFQNYREKSDFYTFWSNFNAQN